MSRRGVDAPWTAAELAVVRKWYPKEPVAAVLARLPGRTIDGIRHAAKRVGVRTARAWTVADDARLRASWGKARSQDLARLLGRSPSAIKQRAGRLGLDADRYFSPGEIELVRELYPTTRAAAIAERIYGTGRSALGIYKLAQKLGLQKCPHWSAAEVERVRSALAEGGTDRAVAARLGLTRGQVTHVRNRLCIPRDAAALLEARRGAVRTQFSRLGIRTGGDLRAMAYRRYALECGWPGDLPPRAVQILNVLAEHGPQTSLALARTLGMRTAGKRNCELLKASAHSALLKGHGTYTGLLVARGLVSHQRRSGGPGSGRRGGRLPGLYTLTPAAITTRETIRGEQRDERGREAAVHDDDAGPGPGGRPGPRRPGGVGRAAQGGGQEGARRAGRRGHRAEAGRTGEGG